LVKITIIQITIPAYRNSVANHLNIPVAAVSVLTDECDPDNLQPVNIQEIIDIAGKAEPNMILLFKELIKEL